MTILITDGRWYETDTISTTLGGAIIFEAGGETIVLSIWEVDTIND